MKIAKLILEFLRVLIWPSTVIVLILAFRSHLLRLLDRLRHADLPGGFGLDLGEEIKEAKALSTIVQGQPIPPEKQRGRPAIPLTEANARMLSLGLRPSPSGLDMSYYRTIAEQDANLALAGLRIEIDIIALNLAKGFKVELRVHESGTRLIQRLYMAGAVTNEQKELTMKVLRVCNAAVHGTPVSREDADDVIDLAEVLAKQYLSWLSWGFDDGWTPKAGRGGD